MAELAHGFLDEADAGTLGAHRPPARKHVRVTPVSDAHMLFQLIEAAILSARTTVDLAYWDLQTDLAVQLSESTTRGLRTWTDLLLDAARRGADVRIIFNDFDPDLVSDFHGVAWQSYSEIVQAALQSEAHGDLDIRRFQAICSLSPLTVRPQDAVAMFAVRHERGKAIAELNRMAEKRGFNDAMFRLGNLPRLWPVIAVDRRARRFGPIAAPIRPVHIGSHHQKFCIVDGRIAFCGGIDAKREVLDDRRHARLPFRHDIACVVEGPCVADIVEHFHDRWDDELAPFQAFVASANPLAPGRGLLTTPLRPTGSRTSVAAPGGTGIAQVLRTRAVKLVSSAGVRPDGQRLDHWEAYQQLIQRARNYVYLENQYLRWPGIGNLLIDRFKANRALQVIIVLPFTPEEARQDGDTDLLTLHGMHLQFELLQRLKSELREHLGLFTLVANQQAPEGENAAPNGKLFGSPLVYVHSKLCLVDDAFGIVGSANLDGLSLFVHDELSVGWFHPRGVTNFRVVLWEELLGVPRTVVAAWSKETFLRQWSSIALSNAVRRPGHRSGFVVPLDLDLVDRGKASPFIPDILARGLGRETAGPVPADQRRFRPASVVS